MSTETQWELLENCPLYLKVYVYIWKLSAWTGQQGQKNILVCFKENIAEKKEDWSGKRFSTVSRFGRCNTEV